ncbi:MAG: hypothetical protein HZC41_19450 [Chloroflexi bacterium]|nr:hypothetical protein [Chloroflexota bacterium]
MRPVVLIAAVVLLGGLGLAAARGNDCPTFVEYALERTDQVCTHTGRNEACYGHVRLDAEPQANVSDFRFSHIGDIAPVSAIRSLRLSAFDPNNSLWGIALMRLQANVPNTIPGQNVTFLLFGDVAVTNLVSDAPVLVDVSAAADVPVMSYPAVTAPALGMLKRFAVVVADGRLADSSWLRVQMPLGVQSVGWIRNSSLSAAGSIHDLEVLDPADARPRYRPMQAFYLTTGNAPAACNQVPANGVLIQSPKAIGKVMLSINNVEVRIGSTVLFQAQPGGNMTITTLEGSAIVKAEGVTREAVAGTRVTVPMDENMQPAAAPSKPEAYPAAEVAPLAAPVSHLDTPVDIHPPLSPEEVAALPDQPTDTPAVIEPIPTDDPTPTGLPLLPSDTPVILPTALPPTLLPTHPPPPETRPTDVPVIVPPPSLPTDVPVNNPPAPTVAPTSVPPPADQPSGGNEDRGKGNNGNNGHDNGNNRDKDKDKDKGNNGNDDHNGKGKGRDKDDD